MICLVFQSEQEQHDWILSQVGGARIWMLATWRAEIPGAHPHISCGTHRVEAVWRIWVILHPGKSNVLASCTSEQILLGWMGPSLWCWQIWVRRYFAHELLSEQWERYASFWFVYLPDLTCTTHPCPHANTSDRKADRWHKTLTGLEPSVSRLDTDCYEFPFNSYLRLFWCNSHTKNHPFKVSGVLESVYKKSVFRSKWDRLNDCVLPSAAAVELERQRCHPSLHLIISYVCWRSQVWLKQSHRHTLPLCPVVKAPIINSSCPSQGCGQTWLRGAAIIPSFDWSLCCHHACGLGVFTG